MQRQKINTNQSSTQKQRPSSFYVRREQPKQKQPTKNQITTIQTPKAKQLIIHNHQHDDEVSRQSQVQDSKASIMRNSTFDDLNTKQFLKTNMDEYFKGDEDRCISCSECMKGREKNVFYKYPKQMKSLYELEYSKFDPNAKSKEFNLDKERERLKVPYKVPRDFTSTNKAVYQPFEVQARQKPKKEEYDGEANNPCFIGSTTYNQTFQNWGANPVMKPGKQQPHIINMKIRDLTAYKEAFSGDKEKMPKFMKDHEDKMKKLCVQKMQRGSLQRHVDAPFQGQSTNHQTFVDHHNKTKKELMKPIDEVYQLVQLFRCLLLIFL